MKNGLLGKASIMPFAGRRLRMMRLRSNSNYKRPFGLVVTMSFVTERVLSNVCLATRTTLDCFIVDHWSSPASERVFMFAYCVFRFEKTTLAETFCCFTMATGDDFRTETIRLSGTMASVCSSLMALPKSTSMAKLSTTVDSTFVETSPILTYNVTLLLAFSQSSDEDVSDGITSLHILDKQSVGMKGFEIRFWWAPVPKGQVTWYIILCSAPTKIRTKYADCPETVLIDVQLSYVSKGKFTSVFSDFPSLLAYPILMSPSACYRHFWKSET